jgi:hypothetical protein
MRVFPGTIRAGRSRASSTGPTQPPIEVLQRELVRAFSAPPT